MNTATSPPSRPRRVHAINFGSSSSNNENSPQSQKCISTVIQDGSEKEHLRRRIHSLKRSLNQKLRDRKPVSFQQYGSITLIDKAWNDSYYPKNFEANNNVDLDIDMQCGIRPASAWKNDADHNITVDDSDQEHFQKRVHSLKRNLSFKMKQRPLDLKLERFGDVTLINRNCNRVSLIDCMPKKTTTTLSTTSSPEKCTPKKRTKPRRYRDTTFRRADSFRAKELLLDGDIQSVRKAVLERKLRLRPRIDVTKNNDYGSAAQDDDYLMVAIQKAKKDQQQQQQQQLSPELQPQQDGDYNQIKFHSRCIQKHASTNNSSMGRVVADSIPLLTNTAA